VVVAALRNTGADVRLHQDYFADDANDEVWLPEVARRNWVILTRDKRIRRRPIEKQALVASGAKTFVLTSGNLRGRDMAEILVAQINRIERLAQKTDPPFVAALTRSGVKLLRL